MTIDMTSSPWESNISFSTHKDDNSKLKLTLRINVDTHATLSSLQENEIGMLDPSPQISAMSILACAYNLQIHTECHCMYKIDEESQNFLAIVGK